MGQGTNVSLFSKEMFTNWTFEKSIFFMDVVWCFRVETVVGGGFPKSLTNIYK